MFHGVVTIAGHTEGGKRLRRSSTFQKRVNHDLIRFDVNPTEDDDEVHIDAGGEIELRLMKTRDNVKHGRLSRISKASKNDEDACVDTEGSIGRRLIKKGTIENMATSRALAAVRRSLHRCVVS